MVVRADTANQRARLYAGFVARNRLVSILRVGVPILAVIAVLIPVAEVYLGSLVKDFSIGRLSVERDNLVVDTPRYAGVTAEGATYLVSADSARAAIGALDLIELTNAKIRLTKADGIEMRADAATALLNTVTQIISIAGVATVSDSTGVSGVLRDTALDWKTMQLTSRGAVSFRFGDGTTLDADGLRYDARTRRWAFERATMVAPASDEGIAE